MIAITISGAAYAAIAATLLARSAIGKGIAPAGEYHIWLPDAGVRRLLALREPRETVSDVILRLAERGSLANITQ